MEKDASYSPIQSRSSTEYEEGNVFLSSDAALNRPHQPLYRRLKAGSMLALLAIYTALIVGMTWGISMHRCAHSRRIGTRFLPSPANDYIVYEPRAMSVWEDEDENALKFFGEPDEETDRNWHNLLAPTNIGISPTLMHSLGRADQGIRLPDGTYYGSVAVLHHLHCLKNIQHALHPSYYGLDNLSPHEFSQHRLHLDHCLHMLKEGIMCQADTTIHTMYWVDDEITPQANFSSPHECVNWERLMEWMVPSSWDLNGGEVLEHPRLGPLFKDGKPSKAFVKSWKDNGFGKLGD